MSHIRIDIRDVIRAGDVSAAIEEWCERSDDTASGAIGPTFSTSGPGSGWSVDHDANDYARRAVDEGACYYVDSSDGRMIGAVEKDDEDEDDGVIFGLSDWSDESVVEIEVPGIEYALDHPDTTAAMAQAVIDYHGACSDRGAWADLIEQVQALAAALGDIDAADLRDALDTDKAEG